MKRIRRTEITLETSQVFEIRLCRQRAYGWCSQCTRTSQIVTPDEAAVLAATNARAIYRLIESGRLHFIETEHGAVLVCLNSLLNSIRQLATFYLED